jgi:hypothetical protein
MDTPAKSMVPGTGGATCVCFHCSTPQPRFVKIRLTPNDRRSKFLRYVCTGCAIRLQREGKPAGADEVFRFYLSNTRSLLSKILAWHTMSQATPSPNELSARRREKEAASLENLRNLMESNLRFFYSLFSEQGIPVPNPGWDERYHKRASALGLDTRIEAANCA